MKLPLVANSKLNEDGDSSNMSATTYRSPSAYRSPRNTRLGPQTPLRSQTSSFGSPSILRTEEDCVVIELGSRFLKVGLAGYAAPLTLLDFGLEQQRRSGDLGRWSTGYDNSKQTDLRVKGWAEMNELWRPDLRGLDLGLVGDKIERALRNAFTKTLLIDSRPRRMLLALPSTLPLPLLYVILDTLFSSFQPPSISLMPTSTLATMAAGLRSALVVDIGWTETVVTTVCEYRELQSIRSIRASKMLVENISKKICWAISKTSPKTTSGISDIQPSLEECEEVLERMIWCQSSRNQELNAESLGISTVVEEYDLKEVIEKLDLTKENEPDTIINLPLNSVNPPQTIQMPFSDFSEPCETVLFASGIPESDFDENELPLHLLLYRNLLKSTMDVRSICMARIVFIGGASEIPGLKTRVMQELSSLVSNRGWNQISGNAINNYLSNPKLPEKETCMKTPVELTQHNDSRLGSASLASLTPQEINPFEELLTNKANKNQPSPEIGRLRAVNSLGAWAGGSLMSGLKVQPVSIIEKEQWAQSGTSRTMRLGDTALIPQRQSAGLGSSRSGTADKPSWDLGIWE